MNSVARSLALRALHRRPAVAVAVAAAGNKTKQAAASYGSTAARLAAYRYRRDAGYLLVPLVAVGACTWLVAAAATRYLMTLPSKGTTTTATTTPMEGRKTPEVVAVSPAD